MGLLPLLLATTVQAQDAALDLWRPPIDARRMLSTETSERRPTGTTEWTMFAGGLTDLDGTATARADVLAGIFLGAFRLGAGLPVHFVSLPGEPSVQAGLGHAALDVKATLVRVGPGTTGLAAGTRVHLPTDTLGTAGTGGEIYLATDTYAGLTTLTTNFAILGVGARDGSRWAATARAGLEIPLDRSGGVALEGALAVPLGGEGRAPTGLTPWEWRLPAQAIVGGWTTLSPPLTLRGGLGVGVHPDGDRPVLRALAGLTWSPGAARRR